MLRALIIGADSFIASVLLKEKTNLQFIPISRIPSQLKEIEFVPNLSDIPNPRYFNVDVVINFAAIVHRPKITDEKIYNDVNYNLAIINAQKAKNAGVKLFIQMSTIAVYGNASEVSIHTPYNPQNLYGISKLRADEELLKMQDDNFKVAIVRPPMVYGGGKAPGNMMRLITLADRGIPLPFKGINNSRDFINVHNLVQYLAIIAEKQLNGVHLLSDQELVSTEYLLNIIYKYLGKKNRLIKIPEFGLKWLKKIRPNEYEKLCGTLNIETNFPYEILIKRYSVEDGIREMVAWYKSSRKL